MVATFFNIKIDDHDPCLRTSLSPFSLIQSYETRTTHHEIFHPLLSALVTITHNALAAPPSSSPSIILNSHPFLMFTSSPPAIPSAARYGVATYSTRAFSHTPKPPCFLACIGKGIADTHTHTRTHARTYVYILSFFLSFVLSSLQACAREIYPFTACLSACPSPDLSS